MERRHIGLAFVQRPGFFRGETRVHDKFEAKFIKSLRKWDQKDLLADNEVIGQTSAVGHGRSFQALRLYNFPTVSTKSW